jgi:hypothetical protein
VTHPGRRRHRARGRLGRRGRSDCLPAGLLAGAIFEAGHQGLEVDERSRRSVSVGPGPWGLVRHS